MRTIATKTEAAGDVIRKSLARWGNRAGVWCSFGKDSMVTLHLALQVDPDVKVVAIMTRFKPQETFDYLRMMETRWKLNLRIYESDEVVPDDLPHTDPDECCRINKEIPTQQALHDFDAWICGLRRTEGRTRKDFEEVEQTTREFMHEEGIITKVNPILDWYEVDVWKYMAIHSIPVHPWYAMGYRSLGCAPCTHLIDDDEAERAGRWKGTSKCGLECGIHTMNKR